MSQSRKKREALVTGGCTGIGFAIASSLEEAGCRVTVTSVDSNDLNRLEVVESGLKARFLDITVNLAIKRLVAEFSRVDVLVNRAAAIVREGREL